MDNKEYISGSAKQVDFPNGGSIIKLSLNKDQLLAVPSNEAGYITIDVCERRSIDQYGNSHYVKVNTFKPDKSKAKASTQQAAPKAASTSGATTDELPF